MHEYNSILWIYLGSCRNSGFRFVHGQMQMLGRLRNFAFVSEDNFEGVVIFYGVNDSKIDISR